MPRSVEGPRLCMKLRIVMNMFTAFWEDERTHFTAGDPRIKGRGTAAALVGWLTFDA
jgi:hypothetical protein